jgi:cytoskeleton protein RodZ
MPDNAKKIETAQQGASVAVKSSALGLGERLRSARKARALSLEQVSDSLHLGESIVLALEDERFDVLGAPVFVRGHLKAYARLVGLSPESVLEAFHETDEFPEVVPTVGRETDHSVTVNPVLWGFWALVILLALTLGIYVLVGDDADPSKPEPSASLTEPVPLASPTEPESGPNIAPAVFGSNDPVEPAQLEKEIAVPVDTSSAVAAAMEFEPETEESPAVLEPTELPVEVVSEAVPAVINQPLRLSLHFLQESWVEISDADRRLLFGLQREGRRRELSGQPPFELLLGNAKGVQLRLNGQPYDIPASSVTGKVARFAITRADIE